MEQDKGLIQHFIDIFQYVSSPVLLFSADFNLCYINSLAQEMMGLIESEPLKLDYKAIIKQSLVKLPSLKKLESHLKTRKVAEERHWKIQPLGVAEDGWASGIALIFEKPQVALSKNSFNNQIVSSLSLLQQLPCYVYWKDLGGKLLGCNEMVARAMGYESVDEVIGKLDSELFPEAVAQRFRQHDQQVMQTGMVQTFYEKASYAHQGERTVLSVKAPLRDENNQIIGVLGISTDVTEQQRQQEKLLKLKEISDEATKDLQDLAAEVMGFGISQDDSPVNIVRSIKNYYESIIARMPGNVYWLDKNFVHLGCNDNVLQMFGLSSRREYTGLTYEAAAKVMGWSEGQVESFKKDDREVMESGVSKLNVEEPPISDVDGKQLYFLSSRVPLKDEAGKVLGVVGISIDITERKQAELALQKAKQLAEEEKERAEQANRSKSDFLAMMSHELRTPLNAIIGMAQMMESKRRLSNKEKSEYVSTIKHSGEELLNLIGDILDYTRADMGELHFEEELVNLRQLAEGVRDKLLTKAEGKGLGLFLDIDKNLPKQVIGDAQRLRQIVTNLVDNSIKYSQKGHVILRLLLKPTEKANTAAVQLVVEDTGIGIPAGQQKTIFERFTQVKSKEAKVYARQHGGVGLGLSIVKRFVEQMQGAISVESTLGIGSKFICDFNFTVPATNRKVAAKLKPLQGMRVLFVSDDEERCNLWQQKLLSWGLLPVSCILGDFLEIALRANDAGNPFAAIVLYAESDLEQAILFVGGVRQEARLSGSLKLVVMPKRLTAAEKARVSKEEKFSVLDNCASPEDFIAPFLEACTKQEKAKKNIKRVSLVGRHILVVEDNLINQRIVGLLLESLKCKTEFAETGKIALEKLAKNTYDVVLMDVGLPDISGIEVTEKFRQLEKERHTPVIALTAHALAEDRERCFQAGIDDYLVKPLDREKLHFALKHWVLTNAS